MANKDLTIFLDRYFDYKYNKSDPDYVQTLLQNEGNKTVTYKEMPAIISYMFEEISESVIKANELTESRLIAIIQGLPKETQFKISELLDQEEDLLLHEDDEGDKEHAEETTE